jgi:predicted O-linked N-acetylglucosamine transferase (SPINDLY family)
MGAPMLSLCGPRPANRNSAAILSRVGLAEWAVSSPEQFIALAMKKADELEPLAALRAELRGRMLTALCDAPHFTQELEEAYRTLWRRWCAVAP